MLSNFSGNSSPTTIAQLQDSLLSQYTPIHVNAQQILLHLALTYFTTIKTEKRCIVWKQFVFHMSLLLSFTHFTGTQFIINAHLSCKAYETTNNSAKYFYSYFFKGKRHRQNKFNYVLMLSVLCHGPILCMKARFQKINFD